MRPAERHQQEDKRPAGGHETSRRTQDQQEDMRPAERHQQEDTRPAGGRPERDHKLEKTRPAQGPHKQ